MFSPDQLVVYPAQGVGVVERLERQTVGGQEAEFYIIRILTNNVTVMVPVRNAASVGLRTLCSKEEAEGVLDSFEDRSSFAGYTGQNWNRRHREYTERLKSASLLDVAHVLKELILIGGEKDLSFGERRLMEQAMSLVAFEIGHVCGLDPEAVKARIEKTFADVQRKEEKKL